MPGPDPRERNRLLPSGTSSPNPFATPPSFLYTRVFFFLSVCQREPFIRAFDLRRPPSTLIFRVELALVPLYICLFTTSADGLVFAYLRSDSLRARCDTALCFEHEVEPPTSLRPEIWLFLPSSKLSFFCTILPSIAPNSDSEFTRAFDVPWDCGRNFTFLAVAGRSVKGPNCHPFYDGLKMVVSACLPSLPPLFLVPRAGHSFAFPFCARPRRVWETSFFFSLFFFPPAWSF